MAETVFSLPDRASGPHWAITTALGDPDWQYRWVDLDGYGVAYTPHGAQTERQHCRRWSESTGERERFGILATRWWTWRDRAFLTLSAQRSNCSVMGETSTARQPRYFFSAPCANRSDSRLQRACRSPSENAPRCAPTSAGVDRALSGHHPIYVVDRINASHGVQHPI